jgi:MFS family permease
MLTGVALSLGCVGLALSGLTVWNFWGALVLLGVGWNFMFIGGTTLLTECHAASERASAGRQRSAIFIAMAASSLSSGLLFTLHGWELMNKLAIPVLLLAAAQCFLALLRRGARLAR